MIDLDQLDAQLERALTDDVRALRNSPARPTFDRAAPPAIPASTGAPLTLAEKLASIADDLDDLDDLDDPPRAVEPAPRPAGAAAPPPAAAPAPAAAASRPAPPAPAAAAPASARPAAAAASRPAPPAPAAATAPPAAPPPAAAAPASRPAASALPRPVRAASRPAVTRLAQAPYFEKRPSEVAPPPTTRAARPRPSPSVLSARERLRQAAIRQAHGYADDGTPGVGGLAARIPAALAQGLLDDVDRDLADHAALASRMGSSDDRLAAASWRVMRAALAGDPGEARDALRVVEALGHADDRYWAQRFWLGLEWGDATEHHQLLDHCRERAYRYGDLVWRGALCLLLARMGRTEEAGREVDAVLAALQGQAAEGFADIVTHLAEAVFLLGDGARAAALQRLLTKVRDPLVVGGPALVCKGASTRFLAQVAWTVGNAETADRHFAAAAATHRAAGALPLLARTLQEWGSTLAGRDDVRAQRCLDESAAIARDLGLAHLPAPALAG